MTVALVTDQLDSGVLPPFFSFPPSPKKSPCRTPAGIRCISVEYIPPFPLPGVVFLFIIIKPVVSAVNCIIRPLRLWGCTPILVGRFTLTWQHDPRSLGPSRNLPGSMLAFRI